jgi:SAM-dependent methyltransferase
VNAPILGTSTQRDSIDSQYYPGTQASGRIDSQYYSKRTFDASEMREFNNWLKSLLINKYFKKSKSILDIACGRGGDIIKFIHAGIDNYVGIDIDDASLRIIDDSALKRYKQYSRTIRNVPPMYFINADARLPLTVEAQSKAIPRMRDVNKELLAQHLENKKFTGINCQFALHYFLSDQSTWDQFCANLKTHTADSGIFIATCFDGKKLYDKLKGQKSYAIEYQNKNGQIVKFFDIVKLYRDLEKGLEKGESSKKSKLSLGIDVYNSLISLQGHYRREYLVFDDFLINELLEKCSLELVETDSFENIFKLYRDYFIRDFKEEGIANADNPRRHQKIQDFYRILEGKTEQGLNAYDPELVALTKASYEMDILNRYYVFRKKGNKSAQSRIINREVKPIVTANLNIDLDKVLVPYFSSPNLRIDPGIMHSSANDVYREVKYLYDRKHKPYVFLIKHHIIEEGLPNRKPILSRDRFSLVKIREGNPEKFMLIYKTPDKSFYPIYLDLDNEKRYYLNNNDNDVLDDLQKLAALSLSDEE